MSNAKVLVDPVSLCASAHQQRLATQSSVSCDHNEASSGETLHWDVRELVILLPVEKLCQNSPSVQAQKGWVRGVAANVSSVVRELPIKLHWVPISTHQALVPWHSAFPLEQIRFIYCSMEVPFQVLFAFAMKGAWRLCKSSSINHHLIIKWTLLCDITLIHQEWSSRSLWWSSSNWFQLWSVLIVHFVTVSHSTPAKDSKEVRHIWNGVIAVCGESSEFCIGSMATWLRVETSTLSVVLYLANLAQLIHRQTHSHRLFWCHWSFWSCCWVFVHIGC